MASVTPSPTSAVLTIVGVLVSSSCKGFEKTLNTFIQQLSSVGKTGKVEVLSDSGVDDYFAANPYRTGEMLALLIYDHDNLFPSKVVSSLRRYECPGVPCIFLPGPKNLLSIGHTFGIHTSDDALACLAPNEGQVKNIDLQVLSDYSLPKKETTRCCLQTLGFGEFATSTRFGFFSALFSKKVLFQVQIEIADYGKKAGLRVGSLLGRLAGNWKNMCFFLFLAKPPCRAVKQTCTVHEQWCPLLTRPPPSFPPPQITTR